jgi:ring-1,2-phenylacetyl-CoA epoxidase subunit PaaB
MPDQWPRYEVFKQDRPDGPFRNVGSIHAPDAELALMNARDVFARRPAVAGLWIVPAEAILARTAEELAGQMSSGAGKQVEDEVATRDRKDAGDLRGEIRYAVFSKQSQRQTMTYVDYLGTVDARSAAEAMRLAPAAFDAPPATVWWICPEATIHRSDAADTADFEAATSKVFRMPNQYHTVFTMRKLRRGEGEDE